MDQKHGKKRINVDSSNENSPKAQKIDQICKDQSSKHNTFKFTSSSSSNNSKLSNIAKLRQQLVEEMKKIEFPLKETKKNFKIQISEVTKSIDNVWDEIKRENARLYSQRESIDAKDEENKILREKLEELYKYQKVIHENVEDISATLDSNESLVAELHNMFTSALIMQENDTKILEEKLNKVTPDEKCIIKLNEIDSKINEQQKELNQNVNEFNQLELKIKAAKSNSEEEKQKITQLDEKIKEAERRYETLKKDSLKQKEDVLNEIEMLKKEVTVEKINVVNSDNKIKELKSILELNRNEIKESETILIEFNNEINLLSKEIEELAKLKSDNEQKNQIALEQYKEHLEKSQNELNLIEQQQIQATNVLERKISEMQDKLKSYKDIESKWKKIEMEIQEEEKIIKESEHKKKTLTDDVKLHYDKINEVKTILSKIELSISEEEKKAKTLEKQTLEMDEKIEKNLNASEENNKIKLPDFKDLGNSEKKTRRQLYTPTISDDMDIDSLPIDEQYVQLTQSKPSSPDKKFFKYSQSKLKRESTPRTKGRSKNN